MSIVLEDLGNAGAYEKITPGDNATGISESNLENSVGLQARAALIVCSSNTIRWRSDGTDPTAAEGIPLVAGGSWIIVNAQNLKRWKCIDAVSGSTGTMYVQIYF